MAFINRMKGQAYIDKTREYLDYLEEHLENVRRAFCELSEICKDMQWVVDDATWHTLRQDVLYHDLSKFSKNEFIQYRKSFFPVDAEEKADSQMDKIWEHHKQENHHHHETVENCIDVIHMVIDWTAMSYRFGDTAQQYYEKNKNKIKLSPEHKEFMYTIFDCIKKNPNIKK